MSTYQWDYALSTWANMAARDAYDRDAVKRETRTIVEDEMDAPESWDSGTVTFDPYI